MELERDALVEIVVSTVAVVLFVAVVVAVGATYTRDSLSSQGALALVGTIVGFVLLMAGIGFWLSRKK
ncbi:MULTISPECIES: hypothetical protein [unclassified Haladaptatus]|uniref:DUF7472 family protein n=1 Tax=unclassified Haladaptatus TaxID=2622732 RepID=UPI0023E78808|nr:MULTISPECIES: hypothetical protein [unclassified Haladaptatus]